LFYQAMLIVTARPLIAATLVAFALAACAQADTTTLSITASAASGGINFSGTVYVVTTRERADELRTRLKSDGNVTVTTGVATIPKNAMKACEVNGLAVWNEDGLVSAAMATKLCESPQSATLITVPTPSSATDALAKQYLAVATVYNTRLAAVSAKYPTADWSRPNSLTPQQWQDLRSGTADAEQAFGRGVADIPWPAGALRNAANNLVMVSNDLQNRLRDSTFTIESVNAAAARETVAINVLRAALNLPAVAN
jgi:hypothetical protein